MIAVIRIRGRVNVRRDVRETLEKLKLERKNSCILVPLSDAYKGMVKTVENWVAYGPVNAETAKKLILKRGKIEGVRLTEALLKEKKIDVDQLVKEVDAGKTRIRDSGISSIFRLTPPRGGFKSILKHYPKGSLGKWPQIDALLEKMM